MLTTVDREIKQEKISLAKVVTKELNSLHRELTELLRALYIERSVKLFIL